jgi:hypothetical protein
MSSEMSSKIERAHYGGDYKKIGVTDKQNQDKRASLAL